MSESSASRRKAQGAATVILPAAFSIALTNEGDDDEVPAYERPLVAKLVYQPTGDEDADNDTAIDRLAQPGLPCRADLVRLRFLIPLTIVLLG